MARTKVKPECRLKSWAEVDEALKRLAECERILCDLTGDMNTELDEVKNRFAEMAKPVQEHIDHFNADICQYVTEQRADMEGKTKELNFGRVGFRISTKLKYVKGIKAADAIAVLLRLGLSECVKTTQMVVADNLKKQPADVLDLVGAFVEKSDQFWLETKQEEIQPVTDRTVPS